VWLRLWRLIPYFFGVVETTVLLPDFDFTLPPELIAQRPAARRDQARLMVVDRAQQRVTHDSFANIGNHLRAGDVLVVNDTKVIPARLRGRKAGTGGKVEVLLLHALQTGVWEVLLKPAAKVRLGMAIEFGDGVLSGCILERRAGGSVVMQFTPEEVYAALDKCGEVPLPPYIKRDGAAVQHDFDLERYQTVMPATQEPLLRQLPACTSRLNSWRSSRSRGSPALLSPYTLAGEPFNQCARRWSSSIV